jgi:UPF0176 protein
VCPVEITKYLLLYYSNTNYAACDNVELKGTILLAEESINATVSGGRNAINKIFYFLRSDYRLKDLTWKESAAEYQPFSKMKVRLKR